MPRKLAKPKKQSAKKSASRRSSTTREPATIAIPCTVSTGMFRNERGVVIRIANGQAVTAIVDATDVSVTKAITRDSSAPGKVRAFIVEERKDTVVVDLPQPTLMGGPRLEVARSIIITG